MSRAAALAAVLLAGCAVTVHDRDRGGTPPPATAISGMPDLEPPITVYVSSFGLAPSLAERHPELREAAVGWGISQRIVEALYAAGGFRFREEKAQMAARLAEGRASEGSAGGGLPEVRWLLYGEVTDVRTSRDDAFGLRRSEVATEVTVQIRLLDRTTGRFHPADGTGRVTRRRGPDLEPRAVGEATDLAVRRAAGALASRLFGPSGG